MTPPPCWRHWMAMLMTEFSFLIDSSGVERSIVRTLTSTLLSCNIFWRILTFCRCSCLTSSRRRWRCRHTASTGRAAAGVMTFRRALTPAVRCSCTNACWKVLDKLNKTCHLSFFCFLRNYSYSIISRKSTISGRYLILAVTKLMDKTLTQYWHQPCSMRMSC